MSSEVCNLWLLYLSFELKEKTKQTNNTDDSVVWKTLMIRKYKGSKTATILLSVGFGLFLICYIIILLLLIQFDGVSGSSLSSELIVTLNVAKDFLLVVISIIGTTLLTALLIEINQKIQLILN